MHESYKISNADKLLMLISLIVIIILSYFLVNSYIKISKGQADNGTWLIAIIITLVFAIIYLPVIFGSEYYYPSLHN